MVVMRSYDWLLVVLTCALPCLLYFIAAGIAQLQEVPASIRGDFNVSFDFPLICVVIALNTRKMEH